MNINEETTQWIKDIPAEALTPLEQALVDLIGGGDAALDRRIAEEMSGAD